MTLTPRERDILTLLMRAERDKAIAEILGISPATVNTHLRHIYRKLGVHSRAQAVISVLRDQAPQL